MPEFIIEELGNQDRKVFSCGSDELDKYFRNQVSQDVRANVAKCYIVIDTQSDNIAGFYTLSAASIERAKLPKASSRKLPKYQALPAVLLGRLAIEVNYQGQGLGTVLLVDAINRAKNSGIGVFALVVDAKDETAKRFYEQFKFISFDDQPLQLFLPLANL